MMRIYSYCSDLQLIFVISNSQNKVLAHYSKYAGTFKKFCQEFLSMVDTRNKLTTYK